MSMPRMPRKPAVHTSMPQLRGIGKNYLTKENHNSEFHQNYGKKLEELEKRKLELTEKIEDHKHNLKRLDEEETMTAVLPADKHKLKKLIPIYKEKRKLRDDIEKHKQELQKIHGHISRVERMEKDLKIKESVFSSINIDLDKVKRKRYGAQEPSELDQYYDKKIDLKKLKKLKRGLYLDILESSIANKMTYKKEERKYDLDKILEHEKQYEQEIIMKHENANWKHKTRQAKLDQRYARLKMMRNAGVHNSGRSPLYPPELMDEGDLEMYEEGPHQRGYSATSGKNYCKQHRANHKHRDLTTR